MTGPPPPNHENSTSAPPHAMGEGAAGSESFFSPLPLIPSHLGRGNVFWDLFSNEFHKEKARYYFLFQFLPRPALFYPPF